jgi:hypothetical protein
MTAYIVAFALISATACASQEAPLVGEVPTCSGRVGRSSGTLRVHGEVECLDTQVLTLTVVSFSDVGAPSPLVTQTFQTGCPGTIDLVIAVADTGTIVTGMTMTPESGGMVTTCPLTAP